MITSVVAMLRAPGVDRFCAFTCGEERRWAWELGLSREVQREIVQDSAARFLGLDDKPTRAP